MSNEEFNSKIYTLLTDLSIKVADMNARLSTLGGFFVAQKDCEMHREKCCARQDNQQDKWMRWGMDLVKLILAATAGGAAGSKIIGG